MGDFGVFIFKFHYNLRNSGILTKNWTRTNSMLYMEFNSNLTKWPTILL